MGALTDTLHPNPSAAFDRIQLFGGGASYITLDDVHEFMRAFDGAPPRTVAGMVGAKFRAKYVDKKNTDERQS
jgi:hypothetical protein